MTADETATVGDLTREELQLIGWSGSASHIENVARQLDRRDAGAVDYLVVRDGDGLPTAKGAVDYEEHAGAGTIMQLATRTDLEGRGLAQRIIREAEQRIRSRGLAVAVLSVEPENARARRLYEYLGYEPFGERETGWEHQLEDGTLGWYTTIVIDMRRDLTSGVVQTELPGVVLRELTVDDAPALFELIERNVDHLGAFGDYQFPADYSLLDLVGYFDDPPDDNLRFGIVERGVLAGRIDLNPVSPPHWSVGYFLDAGCTGRGLATVACRALGPIARANGAVDLYAGVTNGNLKSCAVLERAGYRMIQQMPDRTRWWLPLVPEPDSPVMM